MTKNYMSTDVRTGYNEKEIVELTDDELNITPFNVKMKLVEKIKIKKIKKEKIDKEDESQ